MTNVGAGPAGASTVQIVDPQQQSVSFQIGALAPGASETKTSTSCGFGLSSVILATADSGQVVAESNENNNTLPAATSC